MVLITIQSNFSPFQLGVPPCTEKIEARSRVLSSGSPVFRAMLEGPLAQDRIITITDVDPRAFEILIRYIGWLGHWWWWGETADHRLRVAERALSKCVLMRIAA